MIDYNIIYIGDLGVRAEVAAFCPEGGVGEWHVMLHVEPRREDFEGQLRRLYEAEDRLPRMTGFSGAQYILKRYFLSDSTNQQPLMRQETHRQNQQTQKRTNQKRNKPCLHQDSIHHIPMQRKTR